MQEKSTTMSLREMCAALGVSRRAVQGYEARGLLVPSGKNVMGHLFYDAEAQERVRRINQYQKYGFSLKEIASLLDAPKPVLLKTLEEKLTLLERKDSERKKIIEALRGEIQNLK